MKPLEKLLRHLARTDVTEVALAAGRLPCVKIAGGFKPIDSAPMNNEMIYDVLFAAGGSRYVENIAHQPATWQFKLDGIGVVAVGAVERDGHVQARFAVVKRDAVAERTLPSNEHAFGHAPPLQAMGAPDLEMDLGAARGSQARERAAAPIRRLSDPFQEAQQVPVARAPSAAPPSEPFASTRHGAAPPTQPAWDPLGDPFQQAQAAPAQSAHQAPSTRPSAQHAGGGLPAPRAPSAGPPRPQYGGGQFDDLQLDTASTGVPQNTGALAYALEFNGRADMGAGGFSQEEAKTGQLAFDGSLESLMRQARHERASDMHVIADRPLLLRLCGELVPRGEPIAARLVETLLLQTVPARLHEHFQRDGSVDFGLEHWKFGRFRVNVTRQRTGIKGCLRLIGEETPSLEALRLPEALAAATHHHQGLIVITGPTGHGKTTTLNAIVDLINRETTHHVITIEDPVEYVHSRKRAMMSQREVGTHTKSFRAALKGSLREDPDVIVVGELRDTETVRIALNASETGHLVLGTMNTPSAAKTIDRIIDLFPPGDQQQVRLTLAGGLKLIVSQRLVANVDKTGLVAACEVLPGSVALWNLIRDNKTFQIPSLQQRGKALGIVRLDDSLADLVRSGRTTLQHVQPFAESPDELEARIAGRPAVQLPAGMQVPGQPGGQKRPSGHHPAQGAQAQKKEEKPQGGGLFAKATNIFGKKG